MHAAPGESAATRRHRCPRIALRMTASALAVSNDVHPAPRDGRHATVEDDVAVTAPVSLYAW